MTRRKVAIAFAVIALGTLGVPAMTVAAGRTVEGKIKSFECGDNCYLTIVTSIGAEIVGLCAAPQCASWNENVAMPRKLVGVRVTAKMEMGTQLDDSGNDMGAFPAFTSLKFKR